MSSKQTRDPNTGNGVREGGSTWVAFTSSYNKSHNVMRGVGKVIEDLEIMGSRMGSLFSGSSLVHGFI